MQLRSIISHLFSFKNTSQKLKHTTRELSKFRLVLDQAPAAVYIINKDMHFEYINPCFTTQSGYTKEDLLNKHVNETIYKGRIPESRLHIVEALRKGETWQGELLSYHKTGRTYWASTIASPYKNEKNEVEGFIIIQQDITEHKRIQIALDESEKLYRTLIEKSLDGVVLSQNGKIVMVNKAFCDMVGCTIEEALTFGPNELLAPEDRERVLEIHYQRMRGEIDNMSYNATLLHKTGRHVVAEFNSTTVQVNSSIASFITIRDITERLQKEEELMKAQKELKNLNQNLETRVHESTLKLTEANTQLIRLQKENLQSQFEVLRQQVNPHFLFNSLNVLTSLIKLEPDLAEKFTEHLSKVYRYVLENKDNDLVDLKTELDFLDAYMFLLNIRFMDKIKMDVDISLNTHQYYILPLALQLIIENAIKHNTMSKKMPLHIRIFADEQQMLNVTNNLQERESHMTSTGVGLKNITHRYKMLEMAEPEFYKTETHFVARIPLKKNE